MSEYSANIRKHVGYYTSLIVMLVLGLSLVFLTAHDKQLQLYSLIGTASSYVLWAVVHQYVHHHLTAKIVVEYVLVGLMGLTFSLFLFNF